MSTDQKDLEQQTSRFCDVGGMTVHFHDLGKGEPLVLLHGGGPGAAGWSNYSRNVAFFAQRFRTIVIDIPGFGKSDKKAASKDVLEFMAGAVRGVLDSLDIPKVSFVGNSLGGGVALKFALMHPERVERLVLMGSGGSIPIFNTMPEGVKHLRGYYGGTGPSFEKLKAFIDCLVFDPSQISDELLRGRYENSLDPEVVENPPLKMLAQSASDQLWRDNLGTLPHRTLLVWGREDRTVPLDAAFILLRTIPQASLHVFPQCGHWAQWEKADEFNSLVAGFLERA
ncbi:MAG TPA: alpha/beta fold hydrolase [Ramlibacter sp.]|uniref:alpha/beta fold hydrolase n=1 Tax=Ramlibacter sp. TaxID=1917967 RepID=UPI002C48133F|nr:alpha/beta fold hydrolase [Ramlibacter sp.]HVZ45792.1 alpha/beta fold hydrolase [Ramlibacter sp.]